ncbi:hypothetical protein FQZ97_919830 [compost metagenome]
MGFTGKEAAKWKEAYIQAFNAMEGWARALDLAVPYRDHVVAVASLGSSIAGSLLGEVPARAQR